MKPKAINQEILLFAGTGSTRQGFCVMNIPGNKPFNISLIEELERACRAGILCELVPESTANPFPNQGMYPQPVETETSVDSPIFFPAFILIKALMTYIIL